MKTKIALVSLLLVPLMGAGAGVGFAEDEDTPRVPAKQAPVLFADPASFPKPGDPDYTAKRKRIEQYRNKQFNKMPPPPNDPHKGSVPPKD